MREPKRIREIMEVPGRFQPGPLNSITDIPGVTVGQVTLTGGGANTGVTVIKQHQGNVFTERVPAAVYSGNGHTKAAGTLQIEELGELETYIAMTNTLSVPAAAEGLIRWQLADAAGLDLVSINACVMETNDCHVNDICAFHVKPGHVAEAIAAAGETVEEGAVGAGRGTMAFGLKAGIGTSSRVVRSKNTGEDRDFTVGVLLQANFGGVLNVYGRLMQPDKPLREYDLPRGSCSIAVATDAPMDPLQLRRLAKRAVIGMAMTGSPLYNTSGDIAIAFSAAPTVRRSYTDRRIHSIDALHNDRLDYFFEAVCEAAREAVYNSLTMAVPVGDAAVLEL